jgi:Protein of unknown function (DUF3723)
MQKIDQPSVRALELKAPGVSRFDARTIEGQILGGQIFHDFSHEERSSILDRVRLFKSLIPSLYTFFRNIRYCEVCIQSMKHLTTLSRRDTLFTAFERKFSGLNQHPGQVVVQLSETDFTVVPGSSYEQVDFGYRQFFAFAMRHFREIPQEGENEDAVAMPKAKADKAVLRQFAQLATRLGFESPEIQKLLEYPDIPDSQAVQAQTSPLLVTLGAGEKLKRRWGLPTTQAFEEDRDSLFISNLHDERDEEGEGITSFFVRRSVYLAFFGRPGDGDGVVASDTPGSLPLTPRTDDLMPSDSELIEYDHEADQNQQRGRDDQEQDEQARREGESQVQRAQEEMQKEREEQVQREREEQAQRERKEQAQRKQEEQAQREREEQAQREREEQAQREREEQVQREREEQVQREQEEQAQREQEQAQREREQHRQEQETPLRSRNTVQIYFKIRERGVWRDVESLLIDPSDPSEVARVAKKNARKGLRTFDTNARLLGPDECFEAVTNDGTNTILLIPQNKLDIDEQLLDSASVVGLKAREDRQPKRQAR